VGLHCLKLPRAVTSAYWRAIIVVECLEVAAWSPSPLHGNAFLASTWAQPPSVASRPQPAGHERPVTGTEISPRRLGISLIFGWRRLFVNQPEGATQLQGFQYEIKS
jgi:hypothetical protein